MRRRGSCTACTFSADNDRCGYIVISYSGDGLSKIRAVETPYLYDFLSERDQIKKKLETSGVDLSTASAESGSIGRGRQRSGRRNFFYRQQRKPIFLQLFKGVSGK